MNTSGDFGADLILNVDEVLEPKREPLGDLRAALVLTGGTFSSFDVIPPSVGGRLLKGFRNGAIVVYCNDECIELMRCKGTQRGLRCDWYVVYESTAELCGHL